MASDGDALAALHLGEEPCEVSLDFVHTDAFHVCIFANQTRFVDILV